MTCWVPQVSAQSTLGGLGSRGDVALRRASEVGTPWTERLLCLAWRLQRGWAGRGRQGEPASSAPWCELSPPATSAATGPESRGSPWTAGSANTRRLSLRQVHLEQHLFKCVGDRDVARRGVVGRGCGPGAGSCSLACSERGGGEACFLFSAK